MDFNQVEIKMKELLSRFKSKLEPNINEDINHLIFSAEYGITIEELTNMLYEKNIDIIDIDYNDINKIYTIMKMDPGELRFLKELIK